MWFPRRFARTPLAQRKPPRRQLTVEALEERCLPASGLSAALVADIVPGAVGSNLSALVQVNGTLFFIADDGLHGPELWRSDGTAAGTALVQDLNPGSGGSSLANLTKVGGSLYFTADDGVHGTELWKSDGTAAGTVLVADIHIGSGGSYPVQLTDVAGTLYFSADDGTHGRELWKSDGTAAGTVLVKDLNPVSASFVDSLTNVGGTLYFSTGDPLTYTDALWKSDGTAAGTVVVKDGFAFGGLAELTAVNGTLFFSDSAAAALWKSDGTTTGTVLVKNVAAIRLTDINGTLFFAGGDTVNGWELWKSDGTTAGTVLVKDIFTGTSTSKSCFIGGAEPTIGGSHCHGTTTSPNSSQPADFTNVNGRVYFTATNGDSGKANGRELWTSDGTAAGTVLVKDIFPGRDSSAPAHLTNVNGLLYFTANDGVHGIELWQSNGTAAGTVMVRDINPGSASSDPRNLVAMNNKLYFSADDGTHGRELWDPPAVLGPPPVPVSGTSPFAGSTADNVAGQSGVNILHSEVEPYLAVNPTNPRNAVAAWIQDNWSNGGGRGNVAAVTFDAGATWQQVVIPGLTLVSGGTYQRAADPWLSFAPNGDLYQISIGVDAAPTPAIPLAGRSALLVSKSTDGGLSWSNPVSLIQEDAPARLNDKPSLTADPTNPNYVYAVWDQVSKFFPYDRSATLFARSADGGRTWEAPRTIYQSPTNNSNIGHQILVRPDGTLIDLFTEMDGKTRPPYRLMALRSTDRGATWSGPITVAQIQSAGGEQIADVAVDPGNGNLYAVWADARFSGFQHNSIAFAMSTNGGLTWSAPIRINQATGSAEAFTPSVAVAADGTVAVTFFATPDAGRSTDVWIVHAHPRDGLTNPASWHDEQRLTTASFDLGQAPVRFGEPFLGDYQGLAAAGNSFYALWAQPHGSDPASIFFRDPPPAEPSYTLGPLVQVSGPSLFADCYTSPPAYINTEDENYLVVDPRDANHLVGLWHQQGTTYIDGQIVGVTFDGGTTWQLAPLPVISKCSGGTLPGVSDPWLAFAPNGDLYAATLVFDFPGGNEFTGSARSQVLLSKSTDGGLSWSTPTVLADDTKHSLVNDKEMVLVDPNDPNLVYVVWHQIDVPQGFGIRRSMPDGGTTGGNITSVFRRSTDGGRTWEPLQTLCNPGANGIAGINQIVARPDGTLVDVFTEILLNKNNDGGTRFDPNVSLLRSTDHGQTWLPKGKPIRTFKMQPGVVTDPVTGNFVATDAFAANPDFPTCNTDVAVDPHNGNLYVVWEDNRFSDGQYNSIGFSMSTDGGLTWSTPIAVNQTPTNVAPSDRQAFVPSVAVADDGTVAVTYYDFRKIHDPKDPGTNYWAVLGRPTTPTALTDPASWKTELRLSDQSFDLGRTVFQGTEFIGHYQGLSAIGNNFLALFALGVSDADPASIFFRSILAGSPLQAASVGHNGGAPTLTSQQVDSLLPEAIQRWQDAGVDTAALAGIDVRIIDLGGTTLGLALGHSVWLDANAAGWGWFVDRTPRDDSEFTTPGNQGEQRRMPLLTALEHQVGHLLGHNHEDGGVMEETVLAGVRRTPVADRGIDWRGAVDLLFASTSQGNAGQGPGWLCRRDPICK